MIVVFYTTAPQIMCTLQLQSSQQQSQSLHSTSTTSQSSQRDMSSLLRELDGNGVDDGLVENWFDDLSTTTATPSSTPFPINNDNDLFTPSQTQPTTPIQEQQEQQQQHKPIWDDNHR